MSLKSGGEHWRVKMIEYGANTYGNRYGNNYEIDIEANEWR